MSSPANPPATTINDLPPKLIVELFKHLHPKQLVRCSMVSKRWEAIFANFKVHRLIVSQQFKWSRFKWHGTNRKIAEHEHIDPECFLHLAEKPLLSDLKYFALCGTSMKDDLGSLFSKLNGLRQLEHLEIHLDASFPRAMYLTLPKLKLLVFHQLNFSHRPSFDCPVLSELVATVSSLNVVHPETIKRLETCRGVDVSRNVGSELTRLNNIECLVVQNFEMISSSTLLSLPSLRELHYRENISSLFRSARAGTLDERKRTLREFLRDLRLMRRTDFRLIFAGLQLTETNLDLIEFGVQVVTRDRKEYEEVSDEYIYMRNHWLIDPNGNLDFIRTLDYTRMISVIGVIPDSAFQKFTGVERLVATAEVPDATQFLRFLKCLSSLVSLKLIQPQLGQEFYNQLPASVPSLEELHFGEPPGDVRLRNRDEAPEIVLMLTFDFIEKLPRLSGLFIHQTVTFESLFSLVGPFCELANGFFHCRLRDTKFRISKYPDSGCKVYDTDRDRMLYTAESAEEVVNYVIGESSG